MQAVEGNINCRVQHSICPELVKDVIADHLELRVRAHSGKVDSAGVHSHMQPPKDVQPT
jgi:hypothetical protein